MTMFQYWGTDEVSKDQKLDYWRDAVCSAFLKIDVASPRADAFVGEIRSRRSGQYMVNEVRASRHLVRREASGVAASTEDCFYLNFQRTGRCQLSQAGRFVAVGRGEFCLFDSTRPFDLDFKDDMALTCIAIPKADLIDRLPAVEDLVAHPLPFLAPGSLLEVFAQGLSAELSRSDSMAGPQLTTIFVDLLALSLGRGTRDSKSGRPQVDPASHDSLRFARVEGLMHRLHTDPHLRLVDLASRAGMSPRSLQSLYARRGESFARQLMTMRLRTAALTLSQSSVPITEVAWQAGFSDLSHFCRAFKERYGCSARAYRQIKLA